MGPWAAGRLALAIAQAMTLAMVLMIQDVAAVEPPDCPRPQEFREASRPTATGPATGPAAALSPPPAITAEASTADYRQSISLTSWGPALLPHWCVWIEPVSGEGPPSWLEQRWLNAVEPALATWSALLPITRVSEPERAHLQVLRRRPPRREEDSGQRRASHGRAELRVLEVKRQERWWLEPRVRVVISPDQRQEAIQATALHELGHGFGLWGHSPDPNDAMAAVPGPRPVLELTARDGATLRWLRSQPSLFGQPVGGPSAQPALR